MFYKLDGKYIVLQKDNEIFILSKTTMLNTVENKLFFANPFDSWDGIFWFGRTEEEIRDILSKELTNYIIYRFSFRSELDEFIENNRSIKQKLLIDKYKKRNIDNIPLKDLKTLGLL